jgi:hypothetical protein
LFFTGIVDLQGSVKEFTVIAYSNLGNIINVGKKIVLDTPEIQLKVIYNPQDHFWKKKGRAYTTATMISDIKFIIRNIFFS